MFISDPSRKQLLDLALPLIKIQYSQTNVIPDEMRHLESSVETISEMWDRAFDTLDRICSGIYPLSENWAHALTHRQGPEC